jgi:hypothetical protein
MNFGYFLTSFSFAFNEQKCDQNDLIRNFMQIFSCALIVFQVVVVVVVVFVVFVVRIIYEDIQYYVILDMVYVYPQNSYRIMLYNKFA